MFPFHFDLFYFTFQLALPLLLAINVAFNVSYLVPYLLVKILHFNPSIFPRKGYIIPSITIAI